MSRREVALLLGFAVLAGLLGLALGVVRVGPGTFARTPLGGWLADLAAPDVGDPVTPFTVAGLDGQPVAVPIPGQVVLVNYWASWCGPCREEMPLLGAYAAEQGANGVQVVGIALDDADAARAFARRARIRFRSGYELTAPKDSSLALGNTRGVLPYTVLIDAEGRLRNRHLGAFADEAELRRFLAEGNVAAR